MTPAPWGKKIEISTLGRQKEININSTGCIFYEKTIVPAKKEEKKKIYRLKSFWNFKSLLGSKTAKVAEPEKFSLDDLEQSFQILCSYDFEKIKSQAEKLKNEEFDKLCEQIREKHNSQIVNELIDFCAVKAIELNYPYLAKALKSQNEKLPDEIRSRLNKTESLKIKTDEYTSEKIYSICKTIFQKTIWKHEIHGIRVLESKKQNNKVLKELLPKLEKNLESNPLFPDNYDKKKVVLLPILEAFYPRGYFSGTKFSKFLQEIQNEGQNSLGPINEHEILSHDAAKIFLAIANKILENQRESISYAITKEIDEIKKICMSEKAKNFYYEQFKSKFEIQRGQEMIEIFKIEIKKNSNSIHSWEVDLHYSEMEEIKEETIYRLFRAEVSKDDLQKYSENQTVVLRPKLSEVGKIQQDSLAKVVQFWPVKNHKMGVLLNRDLRTEIEFHNLNNCREAVQKGGQFGKPTAKSDYNEHLRRFLVLRKSENELDIFIYSLDDNLAHRSEGKLDLRSRFGIDDVICFRSAPNGDIVILADDRRVWRIDPRTSEGKKMGIHLDDVENLLIIPDSECLLLLGQNRIVPYIMETSTRLLELPIDYRFDPAQAIVVQFSSQVHLIFKVEGRIYTQVLDCCLNNQMYSLVSRSRQDLKSSETSTLSILDYFSIMYTRFSILDPMGHSRKSHSQILMAYIEKNQFFEEDVKKIERKLAEIGSKIQKPGSSDLGLARNLKILPMGQNNSSTLFERSEPQRLDGWMQELVCFVPVQIARSENNNLILMKDGSPLAYDDCDNAYDLQQRISFGLYETLFRNWNKSIKVVTSMGKQSTGKSYTLNHLSGASFDIAAGRCTDGCWMTVKVTDDCLYVMMDFEGLGTFERSEQEDMLLSIFNASISSITLFKTDFSLGRDTNEMFNRFNQGVNLLKGNERIFSGIFCIIVKDVRESDTKGIIEEFKEKINAVIKREKKKDFITMMFKGGFDVYPFPSLDLPAYYQETEELKNYIQNEVPAMFDNGAQFLELMKTILAKIAIQDFTSLSRKDVDLRVHNLNRFLENAITFGTLADTKTDCPDFILKSFDRKGHIVTPDVHFELEFETEKTLDVQYKDFDLIFENSTESLVGKFSEFVKIDPQNFRNWNAAFRQFTDQAVRQRMSRVLNWVQINIEKWSEVAEFKDQLRQFQTNVNQKLREFQSKFRICQNQCDVCFNFCILLGYHQGNHHCALSDHKCPKFCQYCESDQESETCNLNFGHQEPHKCRDKPHTCREICRYVKCEGTCSSISGHEGQHVCGKSFHNCPEICSLPHCRARCQISADRQHTVHKCVSDSCTAKCGIKGCTVRCVCNDHFHKMPELSDRFKIENEIEGSSVGFETEKGKFEDLDFHFCGNDHGCPEECLDDGFCQVIVERRVTQERFEGRRDQFEYTKKFENIGSKLRCCEKIPAFQTTHPGRHVHTHDSSFIHQCTVRCPTCNNICDKQFGHPGRHNTAHGNMDNCYFVANQDDIDIGDHKYVVGEPSVAEMCHMFCKKLGRGHIHVLPCGKTKEACTPQDSEHKRHQKIEYGPDPENSKDEVHHDEYWKIINFEDPCQVIDIDDFKKCPFYCGSTEHNKDAEKRFCQLDLWHEKVQNLAQINKKNGYVSTDGHYFSCSHESSSKGFHFYFCLDDSGSMRGIPWSDIVQAMKQFCKSRRQSLTDRLSIVQFDSAPLTMCEDIGFDEFHSESYLQFRGGGTCFGLAISHCYQLMKKVHQKDLTPVFIFMSDGGAHDGDSELLQLYQDFSGQGLKSFFIAFGSVQKKLSSLAGLCGGTYSTSLTGLDLKSNFLSISSKFGTTVSVVRSKI
jgi:uncharacterized protein YegL